MNVLAFRETYMGHSCPFLFRQMRKARQPWLSGFDFLTVGRVGIEPTTLGLKGPCSTPELPAREKDSGNMPISQPKTPVQAARVPRVAVRYPQRAPNTAAPICTSISASVKLGVSATHSELGKRRVE